MKKPIFAIKNLPECVKETRARIAAERASVERLEKLAQEIADSEERQATLLGELNRIQLELLASYVEVPGLFLERFSDSLARTAEAEVSRFESSKPAEGDVQKKAATK